MSRFLIAFGVLFIIAGLSWPFLKKLNLGHLPGDLIFKKDNVTLYFPIMTCVIISIILSIIVWLINKF